MTIQTFGVTYTTVKNHFFPQHQGFSTNTTPSSTTVTEDITWAAADLDGKLRQRDIDPGSITTNSAAYYWCAQTLALMVAAKVARSVTGSDPKVAQAWKGELVDRLKALSDQGVAALGDGATATGPSQALGPTDHIDELSLDVGDTSLASDATPIFRQKDLL